MQMTDVRGAMNYVTGTHNFKVGMDLQSGSRQNQWLGLSSLVQARTLGYQLNQVTIFAPPGMYKSNLDYDAGIFAQDRWTLKRLTMTGALRLDLQKESYDAPRSARRCICRTARSRRFPVRTSWLGRMSIRDSAWPTTCSATARRR